LLAPGGEKMTGTGEIACQGIGKVYPGGKEALASVNFTIPTSGIFAIIGRNGAGKTTLARIMSTLLEPSSGIATIDGLDVMADAKKLRERMAVVPQEGRTISWMTPTQTVSSYLLWRGLSYREAHRKAEEAVARVGLEKQADRLNRTLSGGMKRKVLVAMVVASESEFIFLDEPSTGLDPISRQELWRLLTDLGQRTFILLTTHYLEEAEEVAHRIGILDNGRLLALGSMAELRGLQQYQYSLKVPKGTELPPLQGDTFVRRDSQVQIMTTEDEARRVSARLIERKVQFAVNPVSLDDIFYATVARTGHEPEPMKEEP
jgi:ABC-2 type transport system ATP-binding protein